MFAFVNKWINGVDDNINFSDDGGDEHFYKLCMPIQIYLIFRQCEILDFHGRDYEEYVFWEVMPFSPV
jgi:hypothetical protein